MPYKNAGISSYPVQYLVQNFRETWRHISGMIGRRVVPGISLDGAIYKNLSIDDHRDGPQIVFETPWVETDSSSLCNAPFSTGRSRQT